MNNEPVVLPIVKPIIDDLVASHKAPAPEILPHPPKPAELDQDAGGGYNANHTYPQT
jgi:hypothetical protein